MKENEQVVKHNSTRFKRNIIIILFDILCFVCVDIFYILITHTFDNSPKYENIAYLINSAIMLGYIFIMQFALKVYQYIWRYPSTTAYIKLIFADGVGGVLALITSRLIGKFYTGIWHFLFVSAMTALLALTARLLYRVLYKRMNTENIMDRPHINVAIIGAGQLGVSLVNELKSNSKTVYNPVLFVDVDRTKVKYKVCGLPVIGPNEKMEDALKQFEVSEVFIAINNLESERASQLYDIYSKIGCKVKIYDSPVRSLSDSNQPKKNYIREFQIEDLLFRKPLTINDSEAFRYYRNKTVLVTGGGGSIGSEICRQIVKCNPQKLVIFDIYENNAYDIQQELIRTYGDTLDLHVEIGSVRDRDRLDAIFSNYRPDIVFHAAAHKHVPLMEQSGCEAIKNNVIGTYNTADMAEKYKVQKFILISTDKAVNPTNIMGASKRLCEMVIQCRKDSETKFAAVRFGNVLGSNGSVIPLFRRQIASGGPVTITDKRIVRYFMTIPEASQLVLQAGAMADAGELFVLDMGKPVKIYDLAKNMIKLSGFEPDVDIMIEEIGLRPGEKLYEELLMKSETLDTTPNKMIFIERDTPLSRFEIEQKLAILKKAVEEAVNDVGSDKVKKAIIETVPTFKDPDKINAKASSAAEMQG